MIPQPVTIVKHGRDCIDDDDDDDDDKKTETAMDKYGEKRAMGTKSLFEVVFNSIHFGDLKGPIVKHPVPTMFHYSDYGGLLKFNKRKAQANFISRSKIKIK